MGESYRVTTVGMAPAEDRAKRMRFYYMAMGLRVLCVASLFFARGWWIAVALLGAVFLPYFAVMIANAVAATPDEAVDTPEPLGISGTEPVRGRTTESASGADALIVVDAPDFEHRSASGPGAGSGSGSGHEAGSADGGARTPGCDGSESAAAESDGFER